MEKNCVTLETAKKLKVAGFDPQEKTVNWWLVRDEDGFDELFQPSFRPIASRLSGNTAYAAPTAQEIAEDIAYEFVMKGKPAKARKQFYYAERPANRDAEWPLIAGAGPTMAEALASLWLKLQPANSTEHDQETRKG